MKKSLLFLSSNFLAIAFLLAQTTHTVQMTTTDQFSPSSLTIEEGDIVEWVNNDTEAHTTTSGTSCSQDGTWDSGSMAVTETFSFTFNTAGTYSYFCAFHCAMGMVGEIIVTDADITGNRSINLTNLDLKTFPNPFADFSKVEFSLEKAGKVKVEIKDLLGKVVFESVETQATMGVQTVQIDGSDLNNGIYVCTIYFNDVPAGSEYLVKSFK